jgi:hypothetical protein
VKWTVVWQPGALQQLADYWNNGPDRAAIAAASDRIDWLLQRDPLHAGEAREGDERILIELPLAVLFSVSSDDCMVSVFDAWRWSNPRNAP